MASAILQPKDFYISVKVVLAILPFSVNWMLRSKYSSVFSQLAAFLSASRPKSCLRSKFSLLVFLISLMEVSIFCDLELINFGKTTSTSPSRIKTIEFLSFL